MGSEMCIRDRVLLSQLLEKFLDVENVSFRVRVENDDVIEVGDYVNEALVNLIDDLD